MISLASLFKLVIEAGLKLKDNKKIHVVAFLHEDHRQIDFSEELTVIIT